MTFSIKLPSLVAFKAYAVDLFERVAATFIESALAGVTLGQATGAGFWETVGITSLFALAKGLLAYFVPAIGNLKTAGLLSWIVGAIVKSPNSSAVVTVVPPTAVSTDVQTDTTTITPKVSGADSGT